MKNPQVTVVAGPCSIDDYNINEVYEISEITVTNRDGKKQRAVAGTRVVGMKSRTELSPDGSGMGMDYAVYQKNFQTLLKGGSMKDFELPPSVVMAEEIQKKTNMMIATEVMSPLIQMPAYVGKIPQGKLMPWSPAVVQLGWPILEMAEFVRANGWHLGIKNGKWVGEHLHIANSEHFPGKTTMEKTWTGLKAYAGEMDGDIVLIHRGVDVPDKGDYRNLPVHHIASRAKKASEAKLYFDPSHAYGPKMRQHIVPAVIEAMKMKINDEEYLYDGILVETGTSKTDTEQHITVDELREMVAKVAKTRDLVEP